MDAEEKFKEAIVILIHGDVYPSQKNIAIQMNRSERELNGRECIWRREVALGLGFQLKGQNAQVFRADRLARCRICNETYTRHRLADCFTMRLYQGCEKYSYYKT